jgi:hypothetical protein
MNETPASELISIFGVIVSFKKIYFEEYILSKENYIYLNKIRLYSSIIKYNGSEF